MKPCRSDCQCPKCDPEMAAIVGMTTKQYAAYLTVKTARHLQQQRARAVATAPPPVPSIDYAPPDGYRLSMRAAQDSLPDQPLAHPYAAPDSYRVASRAVSTATAHSYAPPDSYARSAQ